MVGGSGARMKDCLNPPPPLTRAPNSTGWNRRRTRGLGMQRSTVRMFLRADESSEARHGSQPSKAQPFAEYLKERRLAGCHNARQLCREITARGCRGHEKVLQTCLEPWRAMLPEAIRRMYGVPEVRSPAPRSVAWWLPLDEEKLKDEERAFIAEITSREPLLKAPQTLTREFLACFVIEAKQSWTSGSQRSKAVGSQTSRILPNPPAPARQWHPA